MNMPVLKDGSPWAGPIAGALVSGIFGIVLLVWSSQINNAAINQANIANAQASTIREMAAELREHDQTIQQLKVSDSNKQAEEERLWKSISDIQALQGTILGSVTTIKDATDETKRTVQDLQTAVGSLTDIIRPARMPTGR
jgi:methyl-accepting chemotaxis protein